MLKRFVLTFFAFIALIVPAALLMAMLVAPASPAPLERPGCDNTLANALADVGQPTSSKRITAGFKLHW